MRIQPVNTLTLRYPYVEYGEHRSMARRQIAICMTMVAAFMVGCNASTDSENAEKVTFVIVGDTAGWIVPCGCSANQSGGLLRRGSLVDQMGSGSQTIVLDVGGAASGVAEYQAQKFAAILQGELAMGLKAHNIGASEAQLGAVRLRELADRYRVPLVSANVRAVDGQKIGEPFRLIQSGALKFAVVGVLDPQLVAADLLADDPYQAVLETLDRLPDDVAGVLLLAYGDRSFVERLAKLLPEVNAVIGGPTGQPMTPKRIANRWVASSTNKGKFAVRIDFGASSRNWHAEVVGIDDQLVDHPAQTANLAEFYAVLKGRDYAATSTGLTDVIWPEPSSDRDETNLHFVGNEACGKCHQDDLQQWSTSKHAIAWHTLQAKQAHVDPYCQQCHTTGYAQAGGFKSIAASQAMINVGCESCHGPGSRHVRDFRQKMPLNAVDECLRCHDRENSPNFEYTTYWQKTIHGVKLDPSNPDWQAERNQ